MTTTLTFYHWLSQISWPKSYLGKMLLISFLGVHIPLLSIILYVSVSASSWSVALPVLVVGLVSTLIGSLVTMVIQRKMLAPMLHASAALHHYLEQGALPTLPIVYTDEAGALMANTQLCIKHLDSLLQLKQNLLAMLSHDLRNPITSVTLAADLMNQQLDRGIVDAARLQKQLAKIKAASQSQLELMNNTLTLVQTEAGKLAVNTSTVTAQRLLELLFAETHLQAQHKGLVYQVETATAPDTQIELDASKTAQVLINLVNNAIKFTPTGGRLTVSSAIDAQEVHFIVKDSGVGMDAATRLALFEPFSRAQRAGTAKEAGTGLGLWICKTFVEAQGGHIVVESQPGEGSCFTIRLPRCEPTSQSNAVNSSAQPQAPAMLHAQQQPAFA